MFSFLKRLPLPQQLSLPVMCSILITAMGSLFIIGNIIIKEINAVANDNLTREVTMISQQLESEYQKIIERTEMLSKILVNEFSNLTIDDSTSVEIKGIASPLATLDNQKINLNFDRVDKFTEITGSTATIFIRHQDDFLRISTSLRNAKQQRVYGTYLGKDHPGYRQLMNGESYIGTTHLFGKNYMTKYQPLRKNNQTIAIIYIGVAYDDILEKIRTDLSKVSIGKSGFIFLLDVGENEGKLLIHPTLSQQNLYQVYPKLRKTFQQLYNNPLGLLTYTLPPQNKPASLERKASYSFVNGWNWVVAIDVDANEQIAVIKETLILLSLASLACSIILAGLIWLFIKNALAPLQEIATGMYQIGQGDLRFENVNIIDVNSKNELDHLKSGMLQMTQKLSQLIGEILKSSQELLVSSNSISSANKSLFERSEEVNSESFQVSSAISQMASSVEEVAKNSEDVALVAVETASMATDGNHAVSDVETSISVLSDAFNQATQTIRTVADDAQNIGKVVDVINAIADQTNLLALNAAIEAARAGESGRGFAVVADEVRTLAQRTQQSTLEIRQVVEKLQSNTLKAVNGMEAGNKQVITSVERVSHSKSILNNIEQSMAEVELRISTIASATCEQSAVSNQISTSANVLKENAQEASLQSEISHQHTKNVIALAKKLQQDLVKFQI
ncbi:MAG: methyl-accepting chemotaxis protein [Colwellia sp.]|nr:methyl-accepting chemotaxis protein [Colwellia sp.]